MSVIRPEPPGLRFHADRSGSIHGLSQACIELEQANDGHWHDGSILAPHARAQLRAALAAPRAFSLDLELTPDRSGKVASFRCAGYWQAAQQEHVCLLAETSDLYPTQRATAQRLRMLQEMVDALPMLILQFDASSDLNCTFAGGALMGLVSPTIKQPLGRDAETLLGPSLYATLRSLVISGVHGQPLPLSWRITDTRGELRVLEGFFRTLLDVDGHALGHLLDAMDTTAHHASITALRLSQQRLRRFAAASSDAIVMHAGEQIIEANPAACQLLSTTPHWLKTRRFIDIVAPQDLDVYTREVKLARGEPFNCRLVNRFGESLNVELMISTTAATKRQVQMAIVRDVRGLREQQEAHVQIRELIKDLSTQKKRAERANRAKSRFMSAASHDLRQPIHALGLMLASLEALVMRPTVPGDVVEDLSMRMGISIDALARLLNALLEVSRLDANAVAVNITPVALSSVLAELDAELQPAAIGRGLRLDVVQTDAWVQADPILLKRILDKLITNAILYTPEGRVLVAARPRDGSVEIQVWDTGIGIAADQLDVIFDEFYRPAADRRISGVHRGLGLGLSIAKRSAELMGARLSVRSQEWRGSMFSLTLPRTQAQTRSHEWALDDPSVRAPEMSARRVLVIDDDKTVLMAMQQLLNAWGHEVWCAATPDQAIVTAISHAQDIDLVLSDFHLGDHGVATDFIDALRACLNRPVPVYVFTADTSVQVAEAVQGLGLEMLHKPVRDDALRQILQQCPA